jgi:uncharacterized membrane protein
MFVVPVSFGFIFGIMAFFGVILLVVLLVSLPATIVKNLRYSRNWRAREIAADKALAARRKEWGHRSS